MKIKFLGAAKTVTGSFYVIETSDYRIAVDCGLFQGNKEIKERNYQGFNIDPASIDVLILTHAHIDHSGLIPKLCRLGFKGPIFCSRGTSDLCSVMLPDSAHIQESEVERKNRKLSRAGQVLLEPIYTVDDALNCLSQFEPINYDEMVTIIPGIDICLRDAGHILGSCIVEMWIEENGTRTKIVFSGDLGQTNQPIIRDPFIIDSADYVLLESTYGDRFHKGVFNRAEQLKQVIDETMAKGGNLVIPAFAVERTQDLLYDLNVLYSRGQLDPGIDIYIDSPLAIAATEIFQKSTDYFDEETREYLANGNNPLKLPNLKYSRTQLESMELNKVKGNTIIISASGMCDAGRIKHHLKYNLWRPESTILFVGYQAAGTLGRRILDGEKLVTIHGEKVAVRADIKNIEAFSAHADQAGLMSWLKNITKRPQKVILVHGEEKSQAVLADLINKELGLPVVIPNWLDEVELIPAEMVQAVAQAGPDKTSFNLAMQAEQLYLKVRTKLLDLFNEDYNNSRYNELIEKLKNIDAQL